MDRWRRFAGMRLEYRAEFDDGSVVELPVVVQFDEARSIWTPTVHDDGASVGELWAPVAVGVGADDQRAIPATWREERSATRDATDYALLSLRNLLQFPFGLASPGWEVRVVVSPEPVAVDLPDEIEAAPTHEPHLLGPYLLRWDGTRNAYRDVHPERIDSVFYASCHPARARGVYEVRFEGYVQTQGIWVASERHHYQRVPNPILPDPLRLAPETPEAAPPVLVERLQGIRFLSGEEIDELLSTR